MPRPPPPPGTIHWPVSGLKTGKPGGPPVGCGSSAPPNAAGFADDGSSSSDMPDDTDSAPPIFVFFCCCCFFCFSFFLRCRLSLSTESSELIDELLGDRLPVPVPDLRTARKMPVERAVSRSRLRCSNSSAKRRTTLVRAAALAASVWASK